MDIVDLPKNRAVFESKTAGQVASGKEIGSSKWVDILWGLPEKMNKENLYNAWLPRVSQYFAITKWEKNLKKDPYICISESLHCMPETNIALLISYTPIQNRN